MSKSKTAAEAMKELQEILDEAYLKLQPTPNVWELPPIVGGSSDTYLDQLVVDEDQQCPHGSRWMLGCYSCRATVDTHTHTVARYTGFTDSYDYCTECGEKL